MLTRFKVPGEGSYSLAAELHAPASRHAPPPSTSSSTSPSSNKAAGSAPATSPPPGPLGLASVTTVSFAHSASLAVPPSQLPVAAPSSAPPTPPAPAPPAPASSGSSIFSLRKFTGLGSTFTSKFSAASSVSTETSDPAEPASLSRSWISSTLQAAAGSAPAAVPVPSLRAPPRAALDTVPPVDAAAPVTRTSSSHSAARNSDASPSTAGTATPSRARVRAPSTPPLGVLVYNAADCVCALDLPECSPAPKAAPPRNPIEPSLTLSLRSPPTAHALLGHEKAQLLVGCANGEVIYYPDISTAATTAPVESSKRARGTSTVANGSVHPPYYIYNRDGAISPTRVVAVRWVPGSACRFIAAHFDGAIIVYDTRNKPHSSAIRAGPLPSSAADTDSTSAPNTSSSSSATTGSSLSLRPGNRDGAEKGSGGDKPDPNRDKGSAGNGSEKGSAGPGHRRTGSSAVATNLKQHEVSVSRVTRKKNQPVTVWQIGCGIITDCAFPPARAKNDSALLAVCGRDGYLRILDFSKETPLIAFRSYFGALLCVSWSPDGRYVAAGGEDDLVSIWCPAEERIVARLEGHTSWVSSVAWDRRVGGGASGRYRLASAGQDTKLLLWDFAVHMLHHRAPHARQSAHMVRLRSYAREPSTVPPASGAPERRAGKLARLRASAHSATHGSVSGVDTDGAGAGAGVGAVQLAITPVVVKALGRAEVPIVGPVVAHVAHAEPLTAVTFQDAGILTADSAGNVKLWSRPPTHDVPPLSLNKEDIAAPQPAPANTSPVERTRARPQRAAARADNRRTRNADLD